MGMGLKSCVSVYPFELVRILLQYKWGTIFRQEWFWRMEELTKRNGRGVWMKDIEKALKRFGASLEWLTERIDQIDGEMDSIRQNGEMGKLETIISLRTNKARSIEEVLEEAEVLIDAHLFNEFSGTKSSQFLKRIITSQSTIEMSILKKAWRT